MTEQSAEEAAPYKKSTAREYLESVVVAVILALFIRTFAVQAFKIPTGSMETNLLIGDHLLVNKLVYSPSVAPLEDTLLGKREVKRGHVVVFKFPEDPSRDFIKRVIGLPGETVEIREQAGLHRRPAPRRALHPLPEAPPEARRSGVRPAVGIGQLGSRGRAAGAALRDGRQSRQQPGQPLLGLPARATR